MSSPDDGGCLEEQVGSGETVDQVGTEKPDGRVDQGEPAQQTVEAPRLRSGVRVHEFLPKKVLY